MTTKMKINHKITIGLGMGALLLASSCSLDRYPYDSIASGDIDANSIETMTLGNYAKMKEEYFYKTIHQYGEYGGDNISLSGPTSDFLSYCYRYERIPNNHYPASLWAFTYNILININKLIPTIEATPKSEAVDHLLGENYFLRSQLYFHCSNVFSMPYLGTNDPDNNLGLPLKTTDDPNYFPARSSVKTVYEQIVKDATLAAKLMERSSHTTPKSNIYASQEVAWALLSRVYLYMGEWETAGKYCDSVINSNRYTLLKGEEYKTYPRQVPETNTETIYAIRMTKDVDYLKYHMDEYSVGAMYSRINEQGWGEMNPSESYLNLLRKNPQDLRFGFVENKLDPSNTMWMIYVVGDEAKKTFDFKTNTVLQQPDGTWKITDGASAFTSSTVQQETASDGTRQHYVTTTAGARYNVWIEPACQKRSEAYPVRYILKCSMQESQAQLYSPVMFRLAEMYLTRAECRYRAGDYQGALDDINIIRERAGIPVRTLAQTSNPSVDVLTWVLDERRLELAWEGHRRYDVFRNQLTLNRRYPGAHLTGAATTVSLEIMPNESRIAEFIPQKEIDAYPGNALVQNP